MCHSEVGQFCCWLVKNVILTIDIVRAHPLNPKGEPRDHYVTWSTTRPAVPSSASHFVLLPEALYLGSALLLNTAVAALSILFFFSLLCHG